jgi:hypothetical protein
VLRLAADENFNSDIVRGLLRQRPDLDIVRTVSPFEQHAGHSIIHTSNIARRTSIASGGLGMWPCLTLKPGDLGRWYLRLNGFATIPSFVLHPESPRESQLTDIDIWGVRFPFRVEFGDVNNHDEPEFSESSKTILVISEVTRGPCKIKFRLVPIERSQGLRRLNGYHMPT